MKKIHLSFLLLAIAILGLVIVQSPSSYDNTTYIPLNLDINQGDQNTWRNITNGHSLELKGNGTINRVRTQSRNRIMLQVNASCQIKINETDENPGTPIQNQTRAVNKYLHIELNRTCAMNATMFRNYTNAELNGLGNVSQFRWAFMNETISQWQYAEQNWFEKSVDGAAVYCNTTHFSLWTILAPNEPLPNGPKPNEPWNANNGTAFQVGKGNRYQVRTQAGFELQFQFNANVSVNITETEASPMQIQSQFKNRVKVQFMNIHINESNYRVNATLSRQFTQQEINQLKIQNRNRLRFVFYNETTEEWEAPKTQWTEGEKLYCNTTHFSLWTIAEETTISDDIPGFEMTALLLALIPITIFYKKKE